MKSVLVTGASGQLGQSIKKIASGYPQIDFTFFNSTDLDITNTKAVGEKFSNRAFDYCINCAAYTNVENSEKEPERAFKVNSEGVKNLATVCKEQGTVLIHISTDYVFDGEKGAPYLVTDATNPINVYGTSKLEGEQHVQNLMSAYFIIRTSWLYSEFGKNFLTTMLELGLDRKEIYVVSDQLGTPTYARDLAKVVIKLILDDVKIFGLYHFSNDGKASWVDFARAIFRSSRGTVKILPVPTSHYPASAKRPKYSVLEKSKIKNILGIETFHWINSLNNFFKNI